MIKNKLGMGGHQSTSMIKDEWITPPDLLYRLGTFDLDPCSPINRPWDTAKKHYNIDDDGLNQKWKGRVWCNPPYGRESSKWLSKLSEHKEGIALLFARTETVLFFNEVWPKASSILFLQGRLYFYHVNGIRADANAGAPSVLISYGLKDADVLEQCGIPGQFIRLNELEK